MVAANIDPRAFDVKQTVGAPQDVCKFEAVHAFLRVSSLNLCVATTAGPLILFFYHVIAFAPFRLRPGYRFSYHN